MKGEGGRFTFTIIIGEEGEYGRRLRKYLESHWQEPLRLFCCTCTETFLECKERADCILLGETFLETLKKEERFSESILERSIIFSSEEKEGYFCRYHPPEKLISMIRDMEVSIEPDRLRKQNGCRIIALFSPVFDENLRQIAAAYMHKGDLYLGMEDVGDFLSEQGNMGDLCYFIGLKKKDIISYIKEIATEKDGVWYVDSPNLYYELLELKQEEYQWFFQCLKESGEYGDVYVGLGSGILAQMQLNFIFDRFLLIDSLENRRQHLSCDYLEQVLLSESRRFKGSYERRCREEILYEAVQ